MAIGAQRRIADRKCEHRVDEAGQKKALPEIAADRHNRECRRITADTPEAELRERQQTSKAVDEIQRRRRHGEDAGRDGDADNVVRAGKVRQRAGKHGRRDDGGGFHPIRMAPRLNRPSGLSNRTAIISTNTAASCQMISKKPPIQLSIRPSSTAAAIAPGMLPSPPMITNANALKMSACPMPGVTSWIGASAAPASPQSAVASTTALRATVRGLMPTITAASRFCAMARIARPNWVWLSRV